MTRVFLSAPFTIKLLGDPPRVEERFRSFLEGLIGQIEAAGFTVTNAHVREDWGADLYPPPDAILADFAGISDCDVLVAVIESPPSPGVQMELGYALAKRIPVLQTYVSTTEIPYLNRALGTVVTSSDIVVDDPADLPDAILAGLRRWEAQHAGTGDDHLARPR